MKIQEVVNGDVGTIALLSCCPRNESCGQRWSDDCQGEREGNRRSFFQVCAQIPCDPEAAEEATSFSLQNAYSPTTRVLPSSPESPEAGIDLCLFVPPA